MYDQTSYTNSLAHAPRVWGQIELYHLLIHSTEKCVHT